MALSRKAKARLARLIKFMSTLPRSANKHFAMHQWFSHDSADLGHDHGIGKWITQDALKHCGTSACAVGWAATVPSFRRAGLRVSTRAGGKENLIRAARFFDIDRDTAEAFFGFGFESPTRQAKTPKQWARMAKQLMAEHSNA